MRRSKYKGLLIAISMASLECYNPTFINILPQVYKFLLYFLSFAFFFLTFRNKSIASKNVIYSIAAISVCQLISAYNAYEFNGQPLGMSVIAAMQGFAYLLLIPLTKSKLAIKDIEQIVEFFTICFLVCSVLNHLSSAPLFGSADEGVDRGATRFRLLGIYWAIFFFLMKINRYAIEGSKKDLYWIMATGLGILLSLTRQDIVVSFILGGMLYFIRTKLVKKLLFASLAAILIFFVLPHVKVVNSLIEKSMEEKAAQSQYDNIRIVAANYYTFEYPRNVQQVIFGVGVPSFGNSSYGNAFQRTQELLRVYREDVGYCGFYYNYGIIATSLLVMLFVWMLFLKLPDRYVYLKYYAGAFLLLNIASAPCQNNVSIIPFMFGLYLTVKVRYESTCKKEKINS